MNGVERLCAFIREREAIRVRRTMGWPRGAPEGLRELGSTEVWTLDPILSSWSFCNVRREDDAVTRWISSRWRRPNIDHPDLWFAMVVARFVNWPDTLEEVGLPLPWNPGHFLRVMADRKATRRKRYTGAYMVRADREHKDKAAYQEAVVFTPMWNARDRLRPRPGDTLNSYHMLLGQFHGLGSFMAAQVVADLKYASLGRASDWWTFAASGPGSRRGLNRVLGRGADDGWTEEGWRTELLRLWDVHRVKDVLGSDEGARIHAQDLQNCLCEFDKYERERLGEGHPRSKFPRRKK